MVVVPTPTAVATPDAILTVATPVLLLLHVPPAVLLLSAVVLPLLHSVSVPVIAPGTAFTVATAVLTHPVDNV